ncbi:MAG TPA: hypothetical protein VHP58_02560 [Alphaproteobacteria bacterium]|nr:hypothetical protein [Alphaproteobacteria bacterium]
MLAVRVNTEQAVIYRASARNHLASALAVQPGDPYSWQRMAMIDLADHELAAGDLLNSFITSPAEPRLLWARLPLAMLLWDELQKRDPEMLQTQLVMAWDNPQLAWETLRYLPHGPARLAEAVKGLPGIADEWLRVTKQPWPYAQ